MKESQILQLITKEWDLLIEPVVDEADVGAVDTGSYKNGTWNGLLGYVANGTADTVCDFYQNNELRRAHFDLTENVYDVRMTFAVGRLKDAASLGMWNLFGPYTLTTWLAVAVMLALQAAYTIMLTRVEVGMKRRQHFEPENVAWRLLRLQFSQGDGVESPSVAGRLSLAVFALFQCLIVPALYQNYLLSSIIRPHDPRPFKDARHLHSFVAEGKYHLAAYNPGHWFLVNLERSKGFQYVALRESTKTYPVIMVPTVQEALECVSKGVCVMATQEDDPAMFLSRQYCDVVFVNAENFVSSHFAFAKGSPFVAMFNKTIYENNMLIRRIQRRYLQEYQQMKRHECNEYQAKEAQFQPLKIWPFVGLMTVFLFGAMAALTAFIAENAIQSHAFIRISKRWSFQT
ncbi:Protein W02A2.5 [Aphelenchoides avenae]|nr:Protein W02A2.5 [Aphelenchus avenae]